MVIILGDNQWISPSHLHLATTLLLIRLLSRIPPSPFATSPRRPHGLRPRREYNLIPDDLNDLELLPAFAASHHPQRPRQLPHLPREPLVLPDKQVHTPHPRGAGRVERDRVGPVVREVDAANADGVRRRRRGEVEGALQLEEGEAGRGVQEGRERVG